MRKLWTLLSHFNTPRWKTLYNWNIWSYIYIYNYIYTYSLLTIQFSTSYNRAKWAQVEDPVLDDRPGLALPLGGYVRSTAPTAAWGAARHARAGGRERTARRPAMPWSLCRGTWNDVWHLMMRVIPKHQQVKLQSLIYIQFVVNHKFYWWLMDVLTMTSHNWTFFVVHETSLFVFSLGCPHVLCSFFVRFEHPPQWVSGPAQWTGADGVSNGWSDRTTILV